MCTWFNKDFVELTTEILLVCNLIKTSIIKLRTYRAITNFLFQFLTFCSYTEYTNSFSFGLLFVNVYSNNMNVQLELFMNCFIKIFYLKLYFKSCFLRLHADNSLTLSWTFSAMEISPQAMC